MEVFNREMPLWLVVIVIATAVGVGIALSASLWWCCCNCKNRKKSPKLIRKSVIKEKSGSPKRKNRISPKCIPLEKDDFKFVEQLVTPECPDFPPLSPLLPPLSPAMSQGKAASIVNIQPKTEPLTSITSSIVADVDARTARLEKRLSEGKVAKMTINVYYCDKRSELVIGVYEVRSIHPNINLRTAYVELRRENGVTSKLTAVRLNQTEGSRKLKGPTEKKFPMSVAEITTSRFKFYLWSTDSYSRMYQAGMCEFEFGDKEHESFTDGNGFTKTGDFKIAQKEDMTGRAELTLALKYINRTGKLQITIQSIADVPKRGWRSVATSLSEKMFLEPSIVVKTILTHEDSAKKPSQSFRTDPVRGYNPKFRQNNRFNFDVPLEEIQKVKLTVEVSHSNLKLASSKIGTLEFSYESTGSEGEHWREMEQFISYDTPSERSHYIKQHPKSNNKYYP